ncbi:hypothetical protein Hanom_Chr02g00129701 [Helianthus anomalus]
MIGGMILKNYIPDLRINDLPIVYRLRSHGSSRFLLYSTSNNPLILKATRNGEEWKRKFFFVKRDSIPDGDSFPLKWKLALLTQESSARIEAIYQLPEIERSFFPTQASSSQHSSSIMSDSSNVPIAFDLEELDNYSGPVQVKKETLVATSSKPSASPIPTPQARARASGSKKRKSSDIAAATPEGFSYEDLGFVDSFEPITSFLNKVNILNLQDAGSQAKEGRDQYLGSGKIAEAKTQYYEDKLKKVTQDAEVKLAAAQVDHEQAMTSFGDCLKNSAVVSLLQARIKIAYESKDAGFECLTWPVDTWVAKLKDLGGSPVPYPTKSGTGEPSKVEEAAVEAGGKTEAEADAGEGGAKDVGEDVAP